MTEFHDLAELSLNEPGQSWGNLGYWKDHDKYSDACRAMARLLADKSDLDHQSRVMDIGFGSGDQLLLWLNRYEVMDLRGINYSQSQTNLAKEKLVLHGYQRYISTVAQGNVSDHKLWRELTTGRPSINRVLALDCAYHFPNKINFFSQAFRHLDDNGRLGLTDFVFDRFPNKSISANLTLKSMLRLSRIPQQNLMTGDEYRQQLEDSGFKDIELLDISEEVMPKFKAWLKGFKQAQNETFHSLSWYQKLKYEGTANFLQWAYENHILRYVIVTACKY